MRDLIHSIDERFNPLQQGEFKPHILLLVPLAMINCHTAIQRLTIGIHSVIVSIQSKKLMYFKIGINSSNVSSVRLRINYIHEMVYLITLCFKSKFRGKNNQQLVGNTSIQYSPT